MSNYRDIEGIGGIYALVRGKSLGSVTKESGQLKSCHKNGE